MSITFIIDVAYEGRYIKECLASIKNDFFSDCEIILLGTNCSEANQEVIKAYQSQYKDITFKEAINEKEKITALNESILNAKGDYLFFLQDIDYIDISGMKIVKEEADKNHWDCVQGKVVEINLDEERYKDFKSAQATLIQSTLYRKQFLIEQHISIENDQVDAFKVLKNKAALAQPEIKKMGVSLCYTRSNSLKYKYDQAIHFNGDGTHIIQRYANSYHELIAFIQNRPAKIEGEDEVAMQARREKQIRNITKAFVGTLLTDGLNYLNLIDDEEERKAVFELAADKLSQIDLQALGLNKNRVKLCNLIMAKDLEGYENYKKKLKDRRAFRKNKKRAIRKILYCRLYRGFSLIKNKQKRVLFIENMKPMSGNFTYIKKEIENYNNEVPAGKQIKCRTIGTSGSIMDKLLYPYHIGRADYIILAEHIPYISYLNKRQKTKVIQTWHAAGAFKRFGHSTSYMKGGPNPYTGSKMELHSNYDYATVSSAEVIPHYAKAFRMKEEQIIPIGLPRADFFFDEEEKARVRDNILKDYPVLEGKKVILYAPTFRGSGKKRADFELKFDYDQLARELSDEYVIVLKLHPSVDASKIVIDEAIKEKVLNLSQYGSVNELLIMTDILITDYSSVLFEYTLLGKPVILYAYDLEAYALDRDLYYPYESFIPGPLAKNMEELTRILKKNEYDLDKVNRFAEKFFYKKDGESSKRFVEQLLLDNMR